MALEQSVDHRLAAAMAAKRSELAAALCRSATSPDGGKLALPEFSELDDYAQEHFLTAVDLAVGALRQPNSQHSDLLLGWLASQLPQASNPGPQAVAGYRPAAMLESAVRTWAEVLANDLPAQMLSPLGVFLRGLGQLLAPEPRRTLKLLLIGDCFVSELAASLVGPCIRAGIGLEVHHVHERVQSRLRTAIRSFDRNLFDLVFFSPFTHGFLPEYAWLLQPSAVLAADTKVRQTLSGMTEEVLASARALVEHFRCPVYVHNAAGTIQSPGLVKGIAKHLGSMRNAREARRFIGESLARRLPAMGEERLRLLDEAGLLNRHSRWQLGRSLLRGQIFHPTRIGMQLSRGAYLDAILTAGYLATKKVVVCDLDNTLWNGVIGEGMVEHYHERQQTLKGLRLKGVLLSINSKNDPKNVGFYGSTLKADDFVAPRINWRPKTENMAAIVAELNLKPKDLVFLDDRPDELERMRVAFPEMVVLDSTREGTWSALSHWQAHLRSHTEEDRTRLYHEKAAREIYLASTPVAEDETAGLAALELAAQITAVRGSALKRVVELVNRTNQFNLCGSRTTLAELEKGLGAGRHIFSVTAQDKFGSMGVVGAMCIDLHGGSVTVPIFVLSCRVFGFGIEYALLNTVKTLADPQARLIGRYIETAHNGPARELYPNSGLVWDGGEWCGEVGKLPPDPVWLKVQRQQVVAVAEPMPATG